MGKINKKYKKKKPWICIILEGLAFELPKNNKSGITLGRIEPMTWGFEGPLSTELY